MGATLKADQLYPVDLWIEERTGIPAQIHVAEAPGNGWLIELTGINDPVDIPTPQVPPAPAGRP